MIADIRVLLAWHRGLHMVMEEDRGDGEKPGAARDGDGPAPPMGDMKRAIQNVRERLVAPTPLCQRLVACLDEMDACVDAGEAQNGVGCGRQRAGNGAGGGPCGEMGMREAARCVRTIPEDMLRLRRVVDEASEVLGRVMGEGEDLAGLVGYAASLDAVADGLDVLEVVTKKVCAVEGGLTVAEMEAVEGVVDVLSMG